jgi:TolB-like protein
VLALLVGTLAAASPSLAAPGFTCTGVAPGVCDAYLEHFVATVSDRKVKVLTKNDVAQVLSIERQRQLMGCADGTSSCLAELAGALGVGNVLTGTVTKVESGYVSTLKVIDGSDGTARWTATTRVDSERALFSFLETKASELGAVLNPPPPGPPFVRFVPGLIGGVVGVSAIAWQLGAGANASVLQQVINRTQTRTPEQVQQLARDGNTMQVAAFASLALGVAGVVTSVLWVLLGAPPDAPPVKVSVALTPQSSAVLLTWEAP